MTTADPIRAMFSLAGRKALITGGSSGIGRAIAAAFADAGAQITITGLEESEVSAARAALAGKASAGVHSLAADHSHWQNSGAVVEQAVAAMGGIDILVNNAGTGLLRPIERMSDAEWSHIQHLNLFAPMALTRAAVPWMKAQKSGRIINISSQFAQVGKEERTAYSASKGGLDAMTRTLAVELAPHGITVNALGAGPVKTGLTIERWNDPDERNRLAAMTALDMWGEPEDLSGLALCLAAETGRFITGQSMLVDGGASIC